jgi:inhibitor of KinA
MYPIRILPAGDAAILVSLPQTLDPALNAWCVSLAGEIQRRCGTMVHDAVVGYCTLTVYFDPLQVQADWIEAQVRECAEQSTAVHIDSNDVRDVAVCYGGELGPDLPDVARFASCSEEEVVSRHCAHVYRVYVVGFIPGFAYMAEVDSRIAAPRRATPRTHVPAGSVAIAGVQTGIYPAVTPGGWNIIGRTPEKPFDPTRSDPFMFKSGDQVRFRPISAADFAAWPERPSDATQP